MKGLLKKCLAVLLAVLCAMSMSAVSFAEETATASGQCGDNVFWSFDEATGTLSISGTGEMYDYDYDNRPWESYEDNIKSVTIGDSVTSIGDEAFYWCTSLTSITIGDSVTSIGNWAFRGCNSLTSITVDEENTAYSSDEYGVLFNKDKTKLIQYPIGNTRTSYTIPDNVTSIGKSAFFNCHSLTSIIIPDSVTSIGDEAFCSCHSLTSVTIGDSVTSIGDSAFRSCESLTNITIPDSVTSIGVYAFAYCESLTSVTIPDSVTSLDGAFDSCDSLTSVTIPDSITSLDGAFGDCTSLTNITIPDSVTSLDGAFYNCVSLTSITIPDGVTSIGGSTFYYCLSLTSVTIPDSVTSIGDSAFDDCISLKTVYYTGTWTQWHEIVIGTNNESLTKKTIVYNYSKPTNVCGENAKWSFDEATGKLTVTGTGAVDAASADWDEIKNSVTYIEIGDGITSVSENTFNGFSALEEIYLAPSVTELGDGAFKDCSKLAIVTALSDSMIFDGVFSGNDPRLFFVAKEGSQTYNSLKAAGIAVNGVSTDKEKDGGKALAFSGKTTIYQDLEHNYVSKLIAENPDAQYLYFDKITFEGVAPEEISIEENVDTEEEYFTLNEVYISASVGGKTVSLKELVQLFRDSNADGIISFEEEEGETFVEKIVEFFEETVGEFVTQAFYAIRSIVTALGKLFRK